MDGECASPKLGLQRMAVLRVEFLEVDMAHHHSACSEANGLVGLAHPTRGPLRADTTRLAD